MGPGSRFPSVIYPPKTMLIVANSCFAGLHRNGAIAASRGDDRHTLTLLKAKAKEVEQATPQEALEKLEATVVPSAGSSAV